MLLFIISIWFNIYIYKGILIGGELYKIFISIVTGTAGILGLGDAFGSIAQATAAANNIFNVIEQKT